MTEIMRRRHYNRYHNPMIGSLLNQMNEQQMTQELKETTRVKQERKMSHSLSMLEATRNEFENRPMYNNKTRKQGQLLDLKVKPAPYIFIPKYKNQTFIMPDRVFAKGKAGKRFHVKMKDSAIQSFRDQEDEEVTKAIGKDQKEKTIISRKVEEFNRIVDEADGVKRAQSMTYYLKNKKDFNYAHTGSQLFSQCEPLLGQQQTQHIIKKKVSLAKTYDFSRRWRPNSRTNSQAFEKTFVKSVYNSREPHPGRSSVL